MDMQKRVQMAAIAGAAKALRFKRENPRATDDEALQEVTREMRTIINQIGTDE